jgi:hypothetical protein
MESGMRVRHSRLIGVACIIAAVAFGLLALLSDSVSFVGALAPVAFLGFGIAILTRPYLIIDENAVVVKAVIGTAQETYGLITGDVIEFDGTRVFAVNEGRRRRLRGVTGWLAHQRDWSAFLAWAERRNARSSSAPTDDCCPGGGLHAA